MQTDSQWDVILWHAEQVLGCVTNVLHSDCRIVPNTAGSELLEQADDGWLLSDKAVLWAKSTVWSRAFNIPYLGQSLQWLPCTIHSALLLLPEQSPCLHTCTVIALLMLGGKTLDTCLSICLVCMHSVGR